MPRPKEDLLTKISRHVNTLDPNEHWLIQRQVRRGTDVGSAIPRIHHNGIKAHPVRLLMEQEHKLHRSHHRIKNTCGFETCINPRHWKVVPNRQPILDLDGKPMLNAAGRKMYYSLHPKHNPVHTLWPVPVFSWMVQEAQHVVVETTDDILNDIRETVERYPDSSAEELLAMFFGDPAITLEMIKDAYRQNR